MNGLLQHSLLASSHGLGSDFRVRGTVLASPSLSGCAIKRMLTYVSHYTMWNSVPVALMLAPVNSKQAVPLYVVNRL